MKPVIVLIIVLALAGGAWWFTGGSSNEKAAVESEFTTSADGIDNTETAENDQTGKSAASESGSIMPSTPSDSVEPNKAVTADAAQDSTENSPFAVIDESQLSEPAVLEQPENVEQQSEEDITASTSGPRSREPFEVPDSYPVTEAAKYFIPKDERGPGRLGGPPPLDFPGGPSDPNRDANGPLFQPPPPPGQ